MLNTQRVNTVMDVHGNIAAYKCKRTNEFKECTNTSGFCEYFEGAVPAGTAVDCSYKQKGEIKNARI